MTARHHGPVDNPTPFQVGSGPPPWAKDAACLSHPHPDWWYGQHDPPDGEFDRSLYAKAREICRDCPVRQECLIDALDRGDLAGGMFGGTTPEERRRVARLARELHQKAS